MEAHPRYSQLSKDKKPVRGSFGYLGRGVNYYSDTELQRLGEGLIEWIKKDGNIWCKYYFLLLEYPISWDMVKKLRERSPEFDSYFDVAKSIQESKLVSEPYSHRNRKDGNHARWILARHHKGEWEEKDIIYSEQDAIKLDKATTLINYLQSKSDLKIADSNINNEDKSKFETGENNA
jgi:hypothetical protein